MGKASRESILERERSVVAHAGRDDRHYQAALEVGLAAEHFGDESLRALYKAIAGIRDGGYRGVVRGPDLRERLKADAAPESATAALAGLRAVDPATEEQTRGDAATIMKHAELRVVRAELDAARRHLDDPEDIDAALRKAREGAARANSYSPAAALVVAGARTIGDSVTRIFQRIGDPAARTERITGIPTGIATIDLRIRGLQPGKVTLVGARPGAGKSAFMTTMLANMIRAHAQAGVMQPVLVYSLEMEKDELVQRVLWALAGVPEDVALYGRAPDAEQRERLVRAGEAILAAAHLIEVETRTSFTASQIDHDIRLWHRRRWPKGAPKGAYGIVMLDYVQVIEGDDKRADERIQISEVSKTLTKAAKDTGLAILALAQIGREAERDQRLPQLRDLKGTGQLEQDAYAIIFLHPVGEEHDALAGRDWRGSVLAVIAKVRGGGRKGIVPLHYRGECQYFSEWDRDRHGTYEEVLVVGGGPAANRRPRQKKQTPAAA
jgi:replicative DNA helicase